MEMENISVSTCATPMTRGVHLFVIPDYSMSKAIGVGEFISSEKFNVGGSDWAIRYYPDGRNHRCKKFISVYLELKSDNAEARAWFGVRLHGRTQITGWRIGTTRLFNGRGNRSRVSGWDKFLERTLLEEASHDLLGNNHLTIECWVNVLEKPLVSSAMAMSSSSFTLTKIPTSEMPSDFGKLLESKEGVDITFLVKREEFPAHKMVLAARSPVFKAEFCGQMIEREAAYITVEEMEPAAFKGLLHFIYTDSLSPQLNGIGFTDANEALLHLLVAADRYGMERMKTICEMELCRTVNVETLSVTFSLADQHQCNKLKEYCFRFMSTPTTAEKVMVTPEYNRLKRRSPSLVMELLEGACKYPKI